MPELSRRHIGMFAAFSGLAVATFYYAQPMLGIMAADFAVESGAIGQVPMLTQLGYAMGILFLAPLGDRVDRRAMVLLKGTGLTMALVVSAGTSHFGVLLVASFAVGVFATLAQDIVSAAAHLAPAAGRGRTVGMVVTGLLTGILLSRVVSGMVAEVVGWRAMFGLAAMSTAGIVVVGATAMPRVSAETTMPYRRLLGSLRTLWLAHASVRRATWVQGWLSVAFSAFWSTLALHLQAAPFHLGSAVAGAFGLAGGAGVLVAPVAGRFADQHGPEGVSRAGAALVAVSFLLMTWGGLLPPSVELVLLVGSVVLFDLGVQASLVAHQTLVLGTDPEARSRLNAILFVGMFVGMAIGSALAGWLFAHLGWGAVTAFASLAAVVAWWIRRRP